MTKTRIRPFSLFSVLIATGAIGLAWIGIGTVTATTTPRIANPGVVQIDSLERISKVFAVSDIHGMYQPLTRLLFSARITNAQGHWIAGNSLLIVVGDSIDKGPQSIDVIDFWMRLTQDAAQQGGAVIHLLGNHEAEFLANPYNDHKSDELLAELAARGMTIADLVDPSRPRGAYLRSMPIAARLGRWLFAHSGYVEQANFMQFSAIASQLLQKQDYGNPFFIGDHSVLEAKDWWVSQGAQRARLESFLSQSGLLGLVFGHQPSALNVKGASAMSSDGRLIKIDNGMAPEAGAHSGSVLVFLQPTQLNALSLPAVGSIASGSTQVTALRVER
jgi:hypothetical protein